MDLIHPILPLLYVVSPNTYQSLAPLVDFISQTRKAYVLAIVACLLALIPRFRHHFVKITAGSVLRSDLVVLSHDRTYDILVAFITSSNLSELARSLVVSTGVSHGAVPLDSFHSASSKELHYYPWNDDFIFWYGRRPFRLRCSNGWGRQDITLSGLSVHLLKRFLEDCRAKYDDQQTKRIFCFQPCSGYWTMTRALAIRPLETVVMSSEVKTELLEDLGEFLDPKTQDWYSKRGISYRRGYLFHGPPGTGKSSLSLVVAGKFNLDIYILNVSLVDDEGLRNLFTTLPSRCIILLEDIDAFNTSRYVHPHDQRRLSISTLLNVIDGIGSSEGRILIMTTNHKETLDKALLRPGRIDLSIYMSLCDKFMLTELFKNIFAPDHDSGDQVQQQQQQQQQHHQTKEAAKIFATEIPENTFSPAQVTSILLSHRNMSVSDKEAVKSLAQRLREMEIYHREPRNGELKRVQQRKMLPRLST